MAQRTIAITGSIDLRATLGTMAAKAVHRVPAAPDSAWWVTHTPDGPASLHLRTDGSTVEGEAWGPGADWALDRMPMLCGSDDRPEGFRPSPGLVAQLHRRSPGLRLGASGRVFETLVPVILGQRVTSVEARRSYRKLIATHGTSAPGPIDAVVPPPAEVLAGLSYADLHPLGVERSRAQIIIEAARRAERLEETVAMDRSAAHRRLLAVRGIGEWTAALVMGAARGDADVVPVGDYHVPNMVAWALAGEPRGTDDRMLELLAPYAGHRRRVLVLLKAAGIQAPRYGPKTTPRNFARS
jgi:3-methyladenine DNA glycosylase/8-oxoguanine DNA glycosylase